jgi:hypothetical protein
MSGSSNQRVWDTQTPYLQTLYGQGQSLAGQGSPALDQAAAAGSQYAGQVGGQIYDPLIGSYNQAFGQNSAYNQAAAGLTPAAIQGLTDIATTPASAGSTALLDKNVAMALEQASQNFRRNVLPGITHDAIAAGQYGGSRGEIAQGLAASDANRQALQAAMAAYSDQYQTDLAAKAQQDQNRLAATQQIQNIMAGQAGNVGAGAQTGGQLIDLGMAPSSIYASSYGNQWLPLQYQQQLLGSPVVLGNSEYSGTAATGETGSIFAPWTSSGGKNLMGRAMGPLR